MQQIQEFLNTIPSTVIAVLGTLFGVLLTLCVNNFVIWKLAHKKAINDAISEKRQREMELRIGVYLPAVEEVTILQSYISTIAQRSLNDTSIIEKMTASLNKILLVGSEETIRSLQAITNKLSEGFYVLLLERMELDYLNQEILNLQTRAQHLGNTIAGLLQQCQPSSTNPNPIMSDGLSTPLMCCLWGIYSLRLWCWILSLVCSSMYLVNRGIIYGELCFCLWEYTGKSRYLQIWG